jgi:hypothetical protein
MGERFEIPINVRATITIDPRLYIKFPTGAEVLADTLKLCAVVEKRIKRVKRMTRKKRRGWA